MKGDQEMKEVYIKVSVSNNKTDSIEINGDMADLMFIASVAVKYVSYSTGKTIESLIDELKIALKGVR